MPFMRSGPRAASLRLGLGIAAGVLYLVTMLVSSGHVPVRILYDGLYPLAPYRWVRPPAFHLSQNEPPAGGTGSVEITANGSEAVSLSTDDGQAVVILPKDGVAPRPGESTADLKFTPLDPEKVALPPPGRRFDGNAYRIEGAYRTSRAPLNLQKATTVVLRYPSEASEIWRYDGSRWTQLQAGAGVVEASLQVYASADQLGIFVATVSQSRRSASAAWWAFALAVVGLVVVAAGVIFSLRRSPRARRGHRTTGGRP